MSKWLGIIVAALAVAGSALAGAKKEQDPPKIASGVFVSATLKEGAATFEVKMALDNEGEKVFELPAQVVVMYIEKNDKRTVRTIRVAGGKLAPEAKGNALLAQGTLVKAEVQGAAVALTLRSGEGEAAGEQQFTMSTRLRLAYRDEAGKLVLQHVVAGGKPEKAEKPAKRERPGKDTPANVMPENF